ncbi:unnamed protein product [Adineta ricciae]|uniref:Uncharacterized protein n=1 Tax=Adineta ricciae TaxID=249248 RepID=A0A814FZU1_ADIRI|nr:unnamed protein product [Adineta ricciae]
MQPSSLIKPLDTKETLDYDNLNIITHPPPPRRRQSGVSLIPFRPYVKCLTSIRQPFSYANGTDKWAVMGRDEVFFTQPNARCIGSLLGDCHISDIIRWDIEGESTRLPMMCKLWMIVDGAVVERGKPHLVQDAAVQVCLTGQNLRMVRSFQQKKHNEQSLLTTNIVDRKRRHSWHDLNEYHSVPYYQYTRPVRAEFQEGTQCDLDNEYFIGQQEVLIDVEEHVTKANQIQKFRRDNARETIHYSSIPEEHAHISITTQTEVLFVNQSTAIDYQFVRMYNLNLETNEILLSSIVNPYRRVVPSKEFSDVLTFHRLGKEYKHRPTSTGDDFPHWWLRLTTDLILADFITNQGEEKEKSLPPPSPRHDQSIQTDVEKSRPSSTTTTSNHYESIDELGDESHRQRIDFRLSDLTHIEHTPVRNSRHVKQHSSSSKHSEADYNLFVSSLNHQQQSSTPDNLSSRTERHHSSMNTTPIRERRMESESTVVLGNLLERYEKTLRERQRAFTIINDQLLDIDDVLNHYRSKVQNIEQSNATMELYRDVSLLSTRSKDDRSVSSLTNVTRDKYRTMPDITPEEMLQGYVSSPRRHLTTSERQPRFVVPPPSEVIRPDYCTLCFQDHHSSSAWVKYNERRVEQLQRRIDLMLQIDDNEEADMLLTRSVYPTTVATVSQRIDDILLRKPQYRSPLLFPPDRIVSSRRYHYRLPYRSNQSLPATPRQTSRSGTRSTTPISKSVRISTRSVPTTPRAQKLSTSTSASSTSRPIVSILRRTSVPTTSVTESTHVWRSKVDGKLHTLKPFSIPRYYRLYNDFPSEPTITRHS